MSDPESGAPVAPEPPADLESSWSPSQDDWQQQQEAIAALLEWQQQQPQFIPPGQQYGQPQQGQPQFDPFADNVGEQIRQIIREETAPFAATYQALQMGEADERAADILSDVVTRDGDFLLPDSGEKALALANQYVEQEAQRHGFGPRAAEAAIHRAYQDVKAWEEQIGKAYHERQMNQLRSLSGAPREPGAFAAGAQEVVLAPGGDEMSIVRKYGGHGQ